MAEYTLEASVKLGMLEYALVASVDPCGSLLAEGIAECHYTGPQPVTLTIYIRISFVFFLSSCYYCLGYFYYNFFNLDINASFLAVGIMLFVFNSSFVLISSIS
jgi:hypothetical protein